jgi:hypothetical protein
MVLSVYETAQMLHSRKINVFILAGFGLILALVLGLIPIVLYSVNRLHLVTENLFIHPFKVNNAALKMETALLSIRDKMLEITLSRDAFKIGQISSEIDLLEIEAREQFAIVHTGFLGNRQRLNDLEHQLDQWRDLRNP